MTEKNIESLVDTLSAPLEDIISSVARGVAEAQQALDLRTIETYKELYASEDDLKEDLRQMGYQPTWYKIPEVNAEIVISLTISENNLKKNPTGFSRRNYRPTGKLKLYAAPIDANYSNQYAYDIKGASKVSFKIVPVPPSPIAEQMKIVPALIGKPINEAIALVELLDIEYEIDSEVTADDVTPVANTSPAPGAILRYDQKLSISLTSS